MRVLARSGMMRLMKDDLAVMKAIKNGRMQGIAAAVAALAMGDPISNTIRGKLSPSLCDDAALLMERLGVSLADFKRAGADAVDLEVIRRLNSWRKRREITGQRAGR